MKPLLFWALLVLCKTSWAQGPAKHVYIVKASGEWVVDSGDVRLKPLMRIPVNARVNVRQGATVDTSYALILRDPRTLRLATLKCQPVERCRGTRQVSQLTFAVTAIPTTARLGELFVQVGGGEETRTRITLVGARGDAQDWGILVLTSGAGWVDVQPITSRLDGDRKGVVLRFCPLAQAGTTPNVECDDAAARPDDCDVGASTRCKDSPNNPDVRAVAVAVFVRNASGTPGPPIATAIGLITPETRRPDVMDLTSKYWGDLESVRLQLTEEEFRALSVAAAQAIVRRRP